MGKTIRHNYQGEPFKDKDQDSKTGRKVIPKGKVYTRKPKNQGEYHAGFTSRARVKKGQKGGHN